MAKTNNYAVEDRSHFRISANGFEIGTRPLKKEALRFSLNKKQIESEAAKHPSPKDHVGRIKITDWKGSPYPKLNGKALSFLQRYELCHAVDIDKDNKQIVFGADRSINCLDEKGIQLWRTPTQSIAWAVNISEDGRVVAAAVGDGTIRWLSNDGWETALDPFHAPRQ